MAKMRNYLLLVQILISFVHACHCKTVSSPNPVEKPLHVGSFNIQKLGNSKLGNKKVMDTVKQVLTRYDLVLVQEIVTTDESLMKTLVEEMNSMVSTEDKYLMVISERLGRDRAKEQYAYIYKDKKLEFLEGKAYPDEDDDFMRPPYIVHFSTPTLRDMKSLVAIGIHTQPKNAANETSALASVYDYAAELYKQKNAILMGDMNAGCQNLRISDWDNIDLWTREEFTWLISHDVDTTLSSNCCPYDRFVIAGTGMENAVIWSSVKIYNFKQAFGLTTEEALEVSDHWPIEVKLRGRVSDDVSKHLSATMCVTLDDNRKTSLPTDLSTQKTALGFKIDKSGTSVSVSKTAESSKKLLVDFMKFAKKYSQLVSREILASAIYKIEHNALEDESSHNFDSVDRRYSAVVEFDTKTSLITLHLCADTSIN